MSFPEPGLNFCETMWLFPARPQPRPLLRYPTYGGTVDIGAFEFGASTVPASASPDLRDSSDTGLSQSDNITKASAPVFDLSLIHI